jgi:hypothetical protein
VRECPGAFSFYDVGQRANRSIRAYLRLYPFDPSWKIVNHCLLVGGSGSQCFESNAGNNESAFEQCYLSFSANIDKLSGWAWFIRQPINPSYDSFWRNNKYGGCSKTLSRKHQLQYQTATPTF